MGPLWWLKTRVEQGCQTGTPGRLIGKSRVGDAEPSRADDVNAKESVRTG
jgi:hypothetical protein